MAIDQIPMTPDGYEKKKTELNRMKNVDMIEITKRVATAREMGDLSENAEYHAAREDQGMLQARIRMVEDELSRAFIVDQARQRLVSGHGAWLAGAASASIFRCANKRKRCPGAVGAGDPLQPATALGR